MQLVKCEYWFLILQKASMKYWFWIGHNQKDAKTRSQLSSCMWLYTHVCVEKRSRAGALTSYQPADNPTFHEFSTISYIYGSLPLKSKTAEEIMHEKIDLIIANQKKVRIFFWRHCSGKISARNAFITIRVSSVLCRNSFNLKISHVYPALELLR